MNRLVLLALLIPNFLLANPIALDVLVGLDESNQEVLKKNKEKTQYLNKLATVAKKVGYRHGYASMMTQQKIDIMRDESRWNTRLNFDSVTSLYETDSVRGLYYIGGIVDEIEAVTEIVDENVIVASDQHYKIIQYPYLAISKPNWRDYLFKATDQRVKEINTGILPKTEQEKEVWRSNITIGHRRGEDAAIQEMRSRVHHVYADLTGMINYALLVETNQINDARLQVRNTPIVYRKHADYEELTLNSTTISMEQNASFNPTLKNWDYVATAPAINSRQTLRDSVVTGQQLLTDITDEQKIILTEDHQSTLEGISNDHLYK